MRRPPAWFSEYLPPTQVHHGQEDGIVPFSHAEKLTELTRNRSEVLEFYSYPEGGHGAHTLAGLMERVEEFLAPYAVGPETGPDG
jgi:fermentation-respiration switch protein FrsA (DUF1100 family)